MIPIELSQYCAGLVREAPSLEPATQAVSAIAGAAVALAHIVAKGALARTASVAAINADGDTQKPLDVAAHDMMVDALRSMPVAYVLSEESAEVEVLNRGGPLAVAMDPIDGSSNIEVNGGIGTIFSIRPAGGAADDAFAPFAVAGTTQIAAGFTLYGPQTVLILSFGRGVDVFTLDRDRGVFILTQSGIRIPAGVAEYAINGSNQRHWEKPVQVFVDECLAGKTGPRGRDFNTRWNASVVAEAFRILQRGGIFLYPSDRRAGYEQGRLRLLYEAAPLAFLIEQAGGRASTGRMRILDIEAAAPHQRAPLIFGCAANVARVEDLHAAAAPEPHTRDALKA